MSGMFLGATWADVVRANASSFNDVDFVVKNTSACNIGGGKGGMHLAGVEAQANVFDFAVRKVAQEYALVGRDALVEGVGHYGIFSGRRYRESIYPRIREFIRKHS